MVVWRSSCCGSMIHHDLGTMTLRSRLKASAKRDIGDLAIKGLKRCGVHD
ncbi:MAG: small-conductance mechanosensitive channel [Halomonas sp. HL-93]|nr:MAG: small-conductance mechanosensitive channel [Halomonas sp. HL-93]